MKKKILITGCSIKKIVLSILTLTMIFASSCSHNAVNAIDEVNENMNVPFPLTLAEKDLKYDDEYERTEGFGGCAYALSKEGLMFSVSGWPDVRDDFHVTEYRFTSNEYEVFGISVGNALDDAVTVLKDYGYVRDEIEESSYGERTRLYKKNEQVEILLHIDKDKNIYEIWVAAITTNKDHVVS